MSRYAKYRYHFALSLALFGAVLVFGAGHAAASPNIGPDQDNIAEQDYYGNSYNNVTRHFKFAVSHDGYTDILSTRIKIYLPTPTGTIRVRDYDMCYKDGGHLGTHKDNYDQSYGQGAGTAITYKMTNTGTGVINRYGKWNGASGCNQGEISFNVSGSTKDPDTGMYPYILNVSVNTANGKFVNLFYVLGPTGSYVSQDASEDSANFGMQQSYPVPKGSNPQVSNPPNPYKDYSTWTLPFAPDCSVTSQTTEDYIEIYDDDNYKNYDVQPRPFFARMDEYDRDGHFLGIMTPNSAMWSSVKHTSPTTNSTGGWKKETVSGNRYENIYTTGSKRRIRLYYTFNRDHIYKLKLYNVYYDNTLQFQLPYDNIYYYVPCQKPITPPNCAGVTFDPARPDPETSFSITGAVNYQNAQDAVAAKDAGDKMFIRVTGPGESYNNGNVPTTLSGTHLSGVASVPASHNTGSYTVTYGMSGRGAVTCTATLVIADQPTITTGGDTGSGAGMSVGGADCAVAPEPKGGIVSWNRGSSGNYAGAGTKYAALALNHLQGFVSAQGTGGLEPSGLSFANTVDGGVDENAGIFGGLFGGLPCIRDYFADATNVQNGNITINGQAIANGTSKTTYVKGNVYITGNVTFSGTYANRSDIPSFSLIVQGNIYIAPGVTQLDGLYVAQPNVQGSNVSDGVIYTCASAPFTSAPLDASLWDNCHGNSLTVNGSLVARQLWLERAHGTLGSGVAAESVNFSPEVWLTIPPATGSGSAGKSEGYDAITSLPPIL